MLCKTLFSAVNFAILRRRSQISSTSPTQLLDWHCRHASHHGMLNIAGEECTAHQVIHSPHEPGMQLGCPDQANPLGTLAGACRPCLWICLTFITLLGLKAALLASLLGLAFAA